jgi:hypothetical protein
MGEELSYGVEAATEYDRAFSHVSSYFLPFLLCTARLAPGQRVLDVATVCAGAPRTKGRESTWGHQISRRDQ